MHLHHIMFDQESRNIVGAVFAYSWIWRLWFLSLNYFIFRSLYVYQVSSASCRIKNFIDFNVLIWINSFFEIELIKKRKNVKRRCYINCVCIIDYNYITGKWNVFLMFLYFAYCSMVADRKILYFPTLWRHLSV